MHSEGFHYHPTCDHPKGETTGAGADIMRLFFFSVNLTRGGLTGRMKIHREDVMIKVWTDEDHLANLRDEQVPYAVDCSIRAFLKAALCGRHQFSSEDDLRTALGTWPAFVDKDHVHHLRRFRWRERVARYWLTSRLMITSADEVALYARRRDRDEAGVIVVAQVEGLSECLPARTTPYQRFLPFARPA